MSSAPSANMPGVTQDRHVRFAEIDGYFIIFQPRTGRYFSCSGIASQMWATIIRHESWEIDTSEARTLVRAFASAQIINYATAPSETGDEPGASALGFHTFRKFDELILRNPEIDRNLVGTPLQATPQDATKRNLVEKIQVRKFVSSIFVAAEAYRQENPMRTFTCGVGNRRIRINVPISDGDARIPLAQAFVESQSSDLNPVEVNITLFDSPKENRGFELGFDWDWHFPLGVVDPYRSGEFRVGVDRHTQTVSAYSPREGNCAVWINQYRDLPYWFAATPFRLQLSWIADQLGWEFIHAAAVQVKDGAMLFAGPSGSGKSTLAIRLASMGYPLLGDDYLLSNGVSVTALYKRLKIHDWSVARVLPETWTVLNPHSRGEKKIIETGDSLCLAELPVKWIAIPRIGEVAGWERMSPGEALTELAPASLSGLLGGNVESLSRLRKIVSGAACFRIHVTENSLQTSDVLHNLVEEMSEDQIGIS